MGGFLAISALVGVGVGLGAAALVFLIDWLEEFFIPFAIDQGHPWVFLTVPTGFLIAWVMARRFAPEIAGDGVPEAHNPGEEEFSEERLQQLLRQTAHLPADEISARISAEMKDWIRDAEQYDDLTFIVMKVR